MIKPLNNYLVAIKADPPEEYKGGLIIKAKESARSLYNVLAVPTIENFIVPGDQVLVDKYDAIEAEVNEGVVYFIKCDRVLAVMNNES